MLFDVPVAAAPTSLAAVSKPKSVRLTVYPKDIMGVSGYDPWFFEFVWVRYPTNTDATNDTNGTEVARRAEPRANDTSELTKGTTYYYRCYYDDINKNKSALSTTASVVYRGA